VRVNSAVEFDGVADVGDEHEGRAAFGVADPLAGFVGGGGGVGEGFSGGRAGEGDFKEIPVACAEVEQRHGGTNDNGAFGFRGRGHAAEGVDIQMLMLEERGAGGFGFLAGFLGAMEGVMEHGLVEAGGGLVIGLDGGSVREEETLAFGEWHGSTSGLGYRN
jgi:hypothetical protein